MARYRYHPVNKGSMEQYNREELWKEERLAPYMYIYIYLLL